MENASTRINGTCVAIDGEGILLRGAPGSGKSDLALRLIDAGATLVADDWAETKIEAGVVHLKAPEPIAGLIEVRGIGVIEMPALAEAPLALVIDLVEAAAIERLPELKTTAIAGIDVASLRLSAFELSAVAKVHVALGLALGRVARRA